MEFNIFKVLEKDDKELIHSSFLKYLLEYWGRYFYVHLFNVSNSDLNIPELEKKHGKLRFDLEITSKDNKKVIIVENKFKSFPNKEQLEDYDNIIRKYHKDKEIYKYLLCFDPEIITFYTDDWRVISYSQLLQSIGDFLKSEYNLPNDDKIFILHYYNFLNEYYTNYNYHIQHIDSLLNNSIEKSNKLWLRLLYSIIDNKVKLEYDSINVKISTKIDPGNTAVPLINIIPEKWKTDGIEKLIQFQGNDVKFYIHTGNKKIVQDLIDKTSISIDCKNGELKKLNNRNAKSYFIYKEKLTSVLPNSINIEMIVDYLMNFYNRIDNIIKK